MHSPFFVLLGADYSGKSTVLREIARNGAVQVVSCDEEFLEPGFGLLTRLRNDYVASVLGGIGKHSTDFLLTLLQTSVVYLRDRVERAEPGKPVLVDSYYYKVLAKCVVTGMVNEDIFALWRSFRQPDGVVYLDTDPATTWRRAGDGAAVNGFEHYGAEPTEAGFQRFQHDLRRVMLREIGHLPVTSINESGGVSHTVRAVERTIVGSDDGDRRRLAAQGAARAG